MKSSEAAEQYWNGTFATNGQNSHFYFTAPLEEYQRGLAFKMGFSNVTVLDTDQGLVLIDTSSAINSLQNYTEIKEWRDKPLHTAIYSHGHVDHVFGVGPFEKNQDTPARVIAHENVPKRFQRYILTKGYNSCVNSRQFQTQIDWPTEYRYPDVTYSKEMVVRVGDEELHLFHDKGETDDATWVWLPSRKVICTGDLVIWCTPNCGNPQKVQRYPMEWAAALRKMEALNAELLFPGHGPAVIGASRVKQLLSDTATFLEVITRQSLELINKGLSLSQVIQGVTVPAEFLKKPYLKPVYDEPEFIVRTMWRKYAGWYDQIPSHLHDVPLEKIARAIAKMVGSPAKLSKVALDQMKEGNTGVARTLIDYAVATAPHDKCVLGARIDVYQESVKNATSLMAKGVYQAVVNDMTRQMAKL